MQGTPEQGTPEHRWKSWLQQTRDLLGKEESDILCLSYLKDGSIDPSLVNILSVANPLVKEADLCTLLPSAWWEDKEFRRSLLWRISKLRGNGKKCVQQLHKFGFEFDGEHVSDGACRESELCVCIFSVLARLPGHQIQSLKENLARLRPINAENVDSCTLLFKMMFSAGILTTSNLDELRESLQRIGASRKSLRSLKKYCEKYSIPWTGYGMLYRMEGVGPGVHAPPEAARRSGLGSETRELWDLETRRQPSPCLVVYG